jgi:hypothetical protein
MEATVQESPAKENKVSIQVGQALLVLDSETVAEASTTELPSKLVDFEYYFHKPMDGAYQIQAVMLGASRRLLLLAYIMKEVRGG